MRWLLLIALLLAAPARAQPTPEAMQMARELLHAMDAQQQIDATMQQMRASLVQTIRARAPSVSEATATEVVDTYLIPEVRAQAHQVVDASVVIWATHASIEDMRAMRDFQLSPAGVRLRLVMPAINAEVVRFSMAWGQRVTTAAFAKHRDALRARGIPL